MIKNIDNILSRGEGVGLSSKDWKEKFEADLSWRIKIGEGGGLEDFLTGAASINILGGHY